MTLGPDDLPPDPFAPDAMVQVVCPCMTDAYHLVLDGMVAKLVCPNCHAETAIFPRTSDLGPHRGWPQHPGMAGMAERDMLPNAPAQHTWTPQCDGLHPPGPCPPQNAGMPPWAFDPNTGTLTNMPQPGQPMAGAGWDQGPPIEVTREELTEVAAETGKCVCPPDGRAANCRIHGPAGTTPALPNFSAGMCNAYLDGGEYDGQITWVMNGPGVDFVIAAAGGPITYQPTSRVKDGRVVYQRKG